MSHKLRDLLSIVLNSEPPKYVICLKFFLLLSSFLQLLTSR